MRRPGGLGCRTRCTRLPAEETGGSWARTIPARRGASAPSSRRLAGRKLAFAQQADRPEATHRLTRGWWCEQDVFAQKRIDQGNFYASKDNEYPTLAGGKRRASDGRTPHTARGPRRAVGFTCAGGSTGGGRRFLQRRPRLCLGRSLSTQRRARCSSTRSRRSPACERPQHSTGARSPPGRAGSRLSEMSRDVGRR